MTVRDAFQRDQMLADAADRDGTGQRGYELRTRRRSVRPNGFASIGATDGAGRQDD
jgi:hypothetical protein